jgi:FkbM family methyltransferase
MSERVRVESCALADRAGEAVLNLKTGNYGQASLNPIRPAGRAGGVLVPVRCVTEFLPERAGHELTVLKIDVEGAEVAALKPLLAAEDHWPDAILMETRHAEEWEIDLVSRILDAGFARRLEADGNTLFVRKDAEIG